MIRTLCIFAVLAIATTYGQDDEASVMEAQTPNADSPPPPVEETGEKNILFQDVFEPCTKPFITENYNPEWRKEQGFDENTTYYAPLLSKGEMFRIAQQLYHTTEFETFKASHLTNSCVREKRDVTGLKTTVFGYNEKQFVKYVNPVIGVPKSYYFPSPTPMSVGGRVYVSLSDNKSFTVYVTCHDDGLGSFVVSSPHKTLAPETLNIAKEHVKALGFKEDFFVEPNTELDCESPLEDVPVQKNLTLTLPFFFSNTLFTHTAGGQPGRFHPNFLFAVKK